MRPTGTHTMQHIMRIKWTRPSSTDRRQSDTHNIQDNEKEGEGKRVRIGILESRGRTQDTKKRKGKIANRKKEKTALAQIHKAATHALDKASKIVALVEQLQVCLVALDSRTHTLH